MLDTIISISIGVFQNVFVHHFASILFKNHPYTEKHNKMTSLFFVLGILSVTIGKLIIHDKKLISKGITIGGFLLIITSIMINWKYLSDGVKLIIFGLCFGGIIWYAYKKNQGDELNKLDNQIDPEQINNKIDNQINNQIDNQIDQDQNDIDNIYNNDIPEELDLTLIDETY